MYRTNISRGLLEQNRFSYQVPFIYRDMLYLQTTAILQTNDLSSLSLVYLTKIRVRTRSSHWVESSLGGSAKLPSIADQEFDGRHDYLAKLSEKEMFEYLIDRQLTSTLSLLITSQGFVQQRIFAGNQQKSLSFRGLFILFF